ncbi:ABC transporter permease [Alloacidobacterium dinghuense]|uniref:ABC transporter permease n=1 Tax=Alloacidobacterium dinghuense TaxID=2763107 RepID=A0A7G8BD62_9BACT|nr:ABC transporter permease [Alloacidobacterium dinghuense]QNI30482.1 ABC transporter permease [Alloacidobacterium dinghuense]
MTAFTRNLKFALRLLRKSPGFAFVAVMIMALGIGANTAIFSVVHAVLLEPLPFRDANRLVQLWHIPPQSSFPGMTEFSVSAANFLDWQKQNHVFEQMALYTGAGYDITGTAKPEAIRASPVSDGFFSVLGVQPLYGRIFLPDEDRPGHNHEVILTYKFWQSHYGSDPSVLGKTINFDGEPYVIVGVMGPKMTKPDFAQVWTPLGLTAKEAAVRGEHHFLAIARLKPGVTLTQAQVEMNKISKNLEEAYPEDDKGWGALARSLREETVGEVRPAALMMLGAVAFVLLIACANVANLILARTFERRKEIAIRSALGASRPRIIQQLLGESAIIALFGGVLGLVAAHFGIELLIKFFADKLPRMGEIGLDAPVLTFTFVLSIATGILSGLLPALSMTKGELNDALKQGLGRTDADSGTSKTRSALVVIEVALSLVLLIGAGLMIRSLWKLQTIDPGFDEHNVLTLSVLVHKHQYKDATHEAQFFDQILQRVRSLPGVASAGAVDNLPLNGGSNQPVAIEGHPAVALSEQPEVSVRVATPGYLPTMHIPVLQGRDISADDTADSPAVVVISQSMAKQFWPNESPMGRHLKLSFFPDKEREIVGVVGDVKQQGLDSSAGIATLYWPLAQTVSSAMGPWDSYPLQMTVRSTTSQNLAIAVTNAIHQVDPDIPVDNVMTLEDFVGETLTQHSFNMQLLAIFGSLALVLCAIGIYSVLAYAVKRRLREIGLRIAFGATLRDVVRLVVVQGMKPTLAGIGIGLVAAFALGRVITSMIYGVSSRDLTTFLLVTVLLVFVSFFASLIPAIRATRVDPLAVLRDE